MQPELRDLREEIRPGVLTSGVPYRWRSHLLPHTGNAGGPPPLWPGLRGAACEALAPGPAVPRELGGDATGMRTASENVGHPWAARPAVARRPRTGGTECCAPCRAFEPAAGRNREGVRRSRGPGEPGGPGSMWHAAWGAPSSVTHRDEAVTSGLSAKSAPTRQYRRPQGMWPAGATTGGRRGNGRDPVLIGSLPDGGSARHATDPRIDPSREAVGLRRLRGGRDRPVQTGPR
jgi:hypothetical protein